MSTDAIIKKYWRAMDVLTNYQQDVLSDDAIRLALSLAVQDAFAAGAAGAALADDLAAIVASQAQAKPEQRQAEAAINQIGRLNEWLEVNAPALYHNPDLDTAAAVLAAIATLKNALEDNREDAASARQELTTLIAERDGLRQQIAHMDVDNAELVRQLRQARNEADARWFSGDHLAESANGVGAVGHVSNVTEPPADWWQHLDPETNDYRISLDAGRRKFREVPKQQRLLLAQAVARHIGGGALPKQADFDFLKPNWMPGGGGLAVTFGFNWSELLNVTPAEVAP